MRKSIIWFIFVVLTLYVLIYEEELSLKFLEMYHATTECKTLLNRKPYLFEFPYWDKSSLIDLKNFRYKSVHQVCKNGILDLLIFVISAPENSKVRNVIRETFGKKRVGVAVVFILGAVRDKELQLSIALENRKYRDIIQGNFVDSYRNLTYKHVMCLKYVVYFCPGIKYVAKTDDDIYSNVDDILSFIKELQGVSVRKDMIICNTVVNNTADRNRSKWAVNKEEYENDLYPPYCQGSALIYGYDVIYKLYKRAQTLDYFWIEDVYVTGIVANLEGIKRFDLSPVYVDKWESEEVIRSRSRKEVVFFINTKKHQLFPNFSEALSRRKKLNKTIIETLGLK